MSYACRFVIPNTDKDVVLSFLPLSHVFERCMQYVVLCGGTEYNYCHDTKLVLEFMQEVKPHWMCIVPGIWEKIHSTFLEQINAVPEKMKKIFFLHTTLY